MPWGKVRKMRIINRALPLDRCISPSSKLSAVSDVWWCHRPLETKRIKKDPLSVLDFLPC